MLDLASTAAAEMEVVDVDVEESEAILSLVLPYTKPEFVAPFVLDFPASFDVVKAMDKYGVSFQYLVASTRSFDDFLPSQIWRGLDAVSRAFRSASSLRRVPPSPLNPTPSTETSTYPTTPPN